MNNKSIIDNLLVNPKLRVVRHLLLIGALAVISFNQTFISYQGVREILGDHILLIGFATLCMYGLMVYFNIYVLVPGLLLRRKYGVYILGMSLTVLVFLLLQNYKDFFVYHYWNIPDERISYFNIVTLLDIISNFLLNIICVGGISLTILMKHWMTDANRVSQLEKQQVQQEVEYLKEQVNPNFLFKILNRTGALSKFEPQKATDMLYKLSQLLRYQLYDTMRQKVLLNSVINFLNNYLALEKLYSQKFDYTLSAEGDITGTFVEPLIFMPFLKKTVSEIFETEEQSHLDVHFFVHESHIDFTCRVSRCLKLKESDFSKIRQRLEIIHKDKYSLKIFNDEKKGEFIIKLQLKRNDDTIGE